MGTIFTIKEVRPRIFLIEFGSRYDLAMYFLRYQEYYESPSPRFRGKSFKILDFMKWYSETYGGGVFTYPNDWAGFNIHGKLISEVIAAGIPDPNEYDKVIAETHNNCLSLSGGQDYCLIGSDKGKGSRGVIRHEIAHGFYHLDSVYRKEMMELVRGLDGKYRRALCMKLRECGYPPKTYMDEVHAYLSTGLPKSFPKAGKRSKPFEKLYNKYYKK